MLAVIVAAGCSSSSKSSAPPATSGSTAAASGTSAAPAIGLPSSTDRVGVTPTSVTISFLGGFGGQVGQLTKQVYSGFQTWVDDVNASGGIHGRKIIVQTVDHMDTPEGGVAACKTVQSNGSFIAVVGIGGDWDIMGCLDKANIPSLYDYSAEPVYKNWKYQYSMLTHLDDSGRATASFIKNKLGGGADKIGVVCLNQITAKYTCDAFAAEAKTENLNIVDTETVQQNQAQFTSEMLKMKQAGVQRVATFGATLEMIGLLRDAKAISFTPSWTMGDFALDFLTLASKSAMTGVTGLRNGVTQDAPTFNQYWALAQKYGHTATPDKGSSFLVYGEGLVLGHALDVAGQDLTRTSFVAGLNTFDNYNNGVTPPLTFTNGDHAGSHDSYPAICCSPDFTWKADGTPAVSF
jgi:ABC-type branched-subunit amino acid transport system substrate-binding protein